MFTAKRFVSVTLVAAFSITVFGCNEKTGDNGSGSFCWIDSNLFESIDSMKTADLKDDYAAAINYEWAASQEPDFSYIIGSAGDAQRTVDRNKRAMINDGSFSNKNIELIRTADGLFCDWEYRDLIGVEPLKKYLGYIEDRKSVV